MRNDGTVDTRPGTALTSELRRTRKGYQENGELIDPFAYGMSVYNSGIRSYESSFENVLEGSKIIDLIRNPDDVTIIDLMSSSEACASFFTQFPQLHGRGLSVALEDRRSDEIKQRDEALHVEQFSGDITRSETWNQIEKWLSNRKADIIIERAVGGIRYIPLNKKMMAILVSKAWALLSDDQGVLLMDVPKKSSLDQLDVNLQEWVDRLSQRGIQAKYDPGDEESKPVTERFGKLKIVKNHNTPYLLDL